MTVSTPPRETWFRHDLACRTAPRLTSRAENAVESTRDDRSWPAWRSPSVRCPPMAANEPPDRPLAGSRQTGSRTAKGGARPVRAGCAARSRSPRMRGHRAGGRSACRWRLPRLRERNRGNGCLGRRGLVIAGGDQGGPRYAAARIGPAAVSCAFMDTAGPQHPVSPCPRVSAVTSYPLRDPASRTIPRSLDSLRAGLAVVVRPGCLSP